MNLTAEQLAGMIDHTFLKPFGTATDIEKFCEEAHYYGFAMVAVNPSEVKICAHLLKDSKVRVGAAIGFPLGQNTTECKEFEIFDAIENGAQEIDMVINIRALQRGQNEIVKREIEKLVKICNPKQVICKVILETCYLTDNEKEIVCQIAKAEGVDFVKTSTGFGSAGATVHDIRLMRRVVGPDLGVKASGGIRDLETVLAMINAGATRIGTSNSVAIMEAFSNTRL